MTKLCIACGVEFKIKSKFHPYQVYCSKNCVRKMWKKRNWDYVLEKQREWFKKKRIENPERFRQFVKDRKHRIRANGGKFSLKEWEEMKLVYNYTCVGCGKSEPKIKLTMDHIHPISKGGKHGAENIQPLCASCNSKKRDKIDFYPARNAKFKISVSVTVEGDLATYSS